MAASHPRLCNKIGRLSGIVQRENCSSGWWGGPLCPPISSAHFSLTKQIHDQGQDNTNEDAGAQGEIKTEIPPLVADIPRQAPQPGQFGSQQEHHPHKHQDDTDDDEHTGEVGHVHFFIIIMYLLLT